MTAPLVVAMVFLGAGLIAGRAGRPAPPPLIIERHANSSLFNDQTENGNHQSEQAGGVGEAGDKGNGPSASGLAGANNSSESQPGLAEEVVYICGARTKKGTPCSRRVHGPVRCWQHKGMRPMVPQEKLIIKDLAP